MEKMRQRDGHPAAKADSRRSGPIAVTSRRERPESSGDVRDEPEIQRISDSQLLQPRLLQTEKMAALGQLVSGIAHELNNPLTSIMGYAQLLLGQGLRPAQLSEARKIFQEAGRARRIVKNLLFFAREAKPERTTVQLNEIIERTLALQSYELNVENIIVERDLDPGLPPTLADPYQLQQVVLNLLVNAEQAILSGRGEGHIWIRTRNRCGDRIRLEVADDGPGIPPEIASRIFEPFFTTKSPGVGTGLGLSIIYGIVHEHGGDVFAENRAKGGSQFVVELPLVHAAAEEDVAVDHGANLPRAVLGQRILVVEDEPVVAQLIADTLRENDYAVDIVLDGRAGLSRLASQPYDLTICDLRMPGVDGVAFFEALELTDSPMRRRILFITGDTMARRSMDFLEKHRLPYLAKPFLLEELLLAVSQQLGPGPLRAPAEVTKILNMPRGEPK